MASQEVILSNGKCSKCGAKVPNDTTVCSECNLKEIFGSDGTNKGE